MLNHPRPDGAIRKKRRGKVTALKQYGNVARCGSLSEYISEHGFARLAGEVSASASLPLRRERTSRFVIKVHLRFTFRSVRKRSVQKRSERKRSVRKRSVRKRSMRKRGVYDHTKTARNCSVFTHFYCAAPRQESVFSAVEMHFNYILCHTAQYIRYFYSISSSSAIKEVRVPYFASIKRSISCFSFRNCKPY